MTTERWERIRELFELVLQCDPKERNARLDAACRHDPLLREEVERLLTSKRVAAPVDSSGASTLTAPASAPPVEQHEFPGTERFVIERRLGAGGFGTVYRAYDRERNVAVALKTLHRLDAESLFRFKREFRALADISHPNLVTLYELIGGQQCFFTMELIEGVNFREYARDQVRLMAALKQLVQGVSALHGAGKLHRDLKPSNVLVTGQGRLAILDFGLVADTVRGAFSPEEALAGTPAYMSPEQAGGLLSEASDWYSVGVMLYEVLVGHPARIGDLHSLGPRELPPGTPRELGELCADLLRRDPQERPTGEQLRRRLGITAGDLPGVVSREVPFVGRESELEALLDAFASAKKGAAMAVYVHGSSGIGKTALARSFLERIQREDAVVVLAGRCHERESMPYNAFDSVIDALSVYLKSQPSQMVRELLPDISLLSRMFPVLQSLVGPGPASIANPADLQEQRRRGFTALRELLSRLAKRTPVVLFIDDLQWGDSDSANLVAELLRSPDAPPLLLIGCYRSEDAGTSPFLRTLSSPDTGAQSIRLALSELAPAEARELASTLLGEANDLPMAGAESIARHSAGNPFFIGELARYAASRSGPQGSVADSPTIDKLVQARLTALPEDARRYLELVAVAGQPIDTSITRRAAGGLEDDRPILSALRAAHLVRTRITDTGQEIEPYHDRIRATVGAHLPDDVTRNLHLRLGRALETSEQQRPDLLAIHFDGAGCREEALRYATAAAEQASVALAFDSSARFYRMALSSHPGGDGLHLLRRKLGDSLSNAGRGAEAAEAYLAAAQVSGAGDALEDRRRAAWQYLISGHTDEGRAVMQALLGAIGMKLAPTPARALLSMLIGRARINLRGLHYREQAAAKVPRKDLIRIDTCWSVAQGLGMVDTIHAADFHARHLLLALRAGEKYRVVRALLVEAAYHGLAGSRRREQTERILATATGLARTCGNPHALGLSPLVGGICAFLTGRWKDSRTLMAEAEAVLLQSCIGTAWELATARLMWSASSFFLGDLKQLSDRLPGFLADADARGDLYQATALRTRIGHAGPLAADQPGVAAGISSRAIARWSVQGFHIQHWWTLIAQSETALYQGQGMVAWDLIERQWPLLERSLLLRMQYILIESLHHRACSALAVAAESPSGTPKQRKFLQAAEGDAASIEREKAPWGDGLALLIRAGVQATRGNQDAAVRLLQNAEAALECADMDLYLAAGRRRRGELIRGDEGEALQVSAGLAFAEQGIHRPDFYLRMLAPGLWSAAGGSNLAT